MDNEQVLNTAIQENAEQVTASTEVKEPEPEWKAPSKEEYEKAIQSASSKAKYEMLKEFGVKGVDDYRAKVSAYDAVIKENESLNTQLKQLKQDMALNKLGVADDYREDFITLVNSKVSDKVDFDTAAKEVLDKNPSWKVSNEPIRMGTEKSEQKQTTPLDKLAEKYEWLRK